MHGRAHWSHSRLVQLLRCGESLRRDDVEREEGYAPPSSAMARGTAVHHVAATAHGRQLDGKVKHPDWPKPMVLRESLPTEEEAADLAATRFEHERRTKGMIAEPDEEDPVPAPQQIGRDKDSAIRMSRYLVTRVAPFVDPVAVEHKLVIEPRDADIRISGVLDLITTERPTTPDGAQRRGIRDYKTGRRAPHEDEADTSGQLSLYAMLDSFANGGQIADVFALDHVIENPKRYSGGPYLVTQETTRTEDDVRIVVEKINIAVDAVKAGVFLPAPPGAWWCSAKFCRWHSTCRFVSKARQK